MKVYVVLVDNGTSAIEDLDIWSVHRSREGAMAEAAEIAADYYGADVVEMVLRD